VDDEASEEPGNEQHDPGDEELLVHDSPLSVDDSISLVLQPTRDAAAIAAGMCLSNAWLAAISARS
jgi:hypothetical protein